MVKLLSMTTEDKEAQIDFIVRLFDPLRQGFVTADTFEQIIKSFFAGDEQSNNGASQEGQEGSFTGTMLHDLREKGVYKLGGYLDHQRLYEAIINKNDHTLDAEQVIQAII